MKHSTVLLGLAAGLASAGAVHFPQHHVHAHARREPEPQYAYTTCTTEWTIVTVTAAPGASGGYKAPVQNPPVQHPPVQNPPVQAAAADNTNDTDAPPPAGDVNAIQIAANKKQQEANEAHQSSMISLQNSYQTLAPANPQGNRPSYQPSQPVQQPTGTTTNPSTGPTNPGGSPPGGSPPGGPGNGKTAATYYNPAGAPGACQNPVTYIAEDAHVVALSKNIMDKAADTFCNQKVTMKFGGKSFDAIVADKCLACSFTGTKKIDVPQSYLESWAGDVSGPGHALLDGWSFDDPALQSKFLEMAATDVTEGKPSPALTPDVA